MEYKKIKKVIEKIYNEQTKETKKQIKSIKQFATADGWRDIYKDKDGREIVFTEKLTQKQHEKPIEKQKEILQNKMLNKASNEFLKKLKYVEILELTQPAKEIEIDVDYTRGGVYGCQAKAKIYVKNADGWDSVESGRTSGCGYDKESTATAQALNHFKSIFTIIAEKLEKLPQKEIKAYLTRKKSGREFVGYGFDFYGGTLGSFSGGVGYSCHDSIILALGFKNDCRHCGTYNNYYKYTR